MKLRSHENACLITSFGEEAAELKAWGNTHIRKFSLVKVPLHAWTHRHGFGEVMISMLLSISSLPLPTPHTTSTVTSARRRELQCSNCTWWSHDQDRLSVICQENLNKLWFIAAGWSQTFDHEKICAQHFSTNIKEDVQLVQKIKLKDHLLPGIQAER